MTPYETPVRDNATTAVVRTLLSMHARRRELAVLKMIAFVDGFAASRRRREPGWVAWPMSEGLAATLIRGEHLRRLAA